jgi:uridylate kinase
MESPRLLIQKYGGTSVETPERIVAIARRIESLKREGHDLIVVVSAMGRTTDQLLQLASQITARPNRRELDMLLTTGERISMSLLAMALNDIGVPAISLTGSQSGIVTSSDHNRARIHSIRPARIEEALSEGKVVLVAGFQGVSLQKDVTTLGRGGSDLTAVALAAHFRAFRCDILTDVAGVYSGDPRIIANPIRFKHISHWDLVRLSALGAKVMHHRAATLAMKHHVPVWIAHSVRQSEGTAIDDTKGEGTSIFAVTGKSQVTVVRARFLATARPSWEKLKKMWLEDGVEEPWLAWMQPMGEEVLVTEIHVDPPDLMKRTVVPNGVRVVWDTEKAAVAVVAPEGQPRDWKKVSDSVACASGPCEIWGAHPFAVYIVSREAFAPLTERLHDILISSRVREGKQVGFAAV